VKDQFKTKNPTVNVSGDHATVRYPGTGLSDTDLGGTTVHLVKVDGTWYISALSA
jgi:hypothetical protein